MDDAYIEGMEGELTECLSENGAELSSTESELLLESLESSLEESSEVISGDISSIVIYSHFSSYEDFSGIFIFGISAGFLLSFLVGLVGFGISAMINILKKGGN